MLSRLSCAWDIRVRATSGLSCAWDLGVLPSARLSTNWDVLQHGLMRWQSDWHLTSNAASGLVIRWGEPVLILCPLFHVTLLGQPVRARFGAAWGVRTETHLHSSWMVLQKGFSRSSFPWSDATPVCSGLQSNWSACPPVRARLSAAWSDPETVNVRLATSWFGLTTLRAGFSTPWDCRSNQPVAAAYRATWALSGAIRVVIIDNWPVLIHAARTLRVHEASLSIDEGSPLWLASITLGNAQDFARLSLGDFISLQIGDTVYALVIETLTANRPEPGRTECTLYAASPARLYDTPFSSAAAYSITAATSARSLVEEWMQGIDVVWDLYDWQIPPTTFAEMTPLARVRTVVEAIGGTLESAPDGTLTARKLYPVSVPEWYTADGAAQWEDKDIESISSRLTATDICDRVSIANDTAVYSASDTLVYHRDADNDYAGQVWAWPDPVRDCTLVHTGHPDTRIVTHGWQTHVIEFELVEFIAGAAQTQYPVDAITALAWEHNSLGSLGDVVADGTTLNTAIPGYSLAWVTYETRCLTFDVALALDRYVQFVLMEV